MMQQHKPDTVLVIIAMAAEAAPCIEALDLKPEENVFDRRLPMKAYCGHRGKIELMLAVTALIPGSAWIRLRPSPLPCLPTPPLSGLIRIW